MQQWLDLTGSYTKFVYGRAHTGNTTGVYSVGEKPWGSYADTDSNDDVDFFVTLGDAYNDGTYQIMYQWAHIFNTKGQEYNDPSTKKDAAGTADLFSLALKVDGIGDGINDFLDDTTFFISGDYANYNADDGYQLLCSDNGGSQDWTFILVGAVMPDMITENGRLGIEYNHGSKYWTPMTWAEDTAIGSKIAVRGDAYEGYWNFDLFCVKYLPSQVRYTYTQHDYIPNINCAGWVDSAPDLRFSVTSRYSIPIKIKGIN